MHAKFDFYEIVSIRPAEKIPRNLWGTQGVVVGRAQDEQGVWHYGVQMFADDNKCWALEEGILDPEGRKMRREDLYSGETIRVRVDPKTGRGSVI